ncbi:PRTRC system protein B [Ornithobacterium rhinotracheale]
MNNIIDITNEIAPIFYAKKALVFYEENKLSQMYVECFDIDQNGLMKNAHPLSDEESKALINALDIENKTKNSNFKANGLLPNNVLHIDPSEGGSIIWYTKVQKQNLFFSSNLGVPNGQAYIPPLLWKANDKHISIYALKENRKPTLKTKLCFSPFFNVYRTGDVCMGSVKIKIPKTASLEEFIAMWQTYFFQSYFSHLQGFNPIKGNLINVWKSLIGTTQKFPIEELKFNNKTLKDIL